VTARESSCSSWSVCTRTPSPPTIVTWATASGTTDATASIAGCDSAFSTPAIWNCDPPRNSMLRLTPRSTGTSTVRMISTAAIAYHFLRPPTKLNERLPV
jgi:hypothetical protein